MKNQSLFLLLKLSIHGSFYDSIQFEINTD